MLTRFGDINTNDDIPLTVITVIADMDSFIKNGGIATLVLGTKVVADAGVTINSLIIVTPSSGGILNGNVRVSSQTAGVGFTLLSSNLLDTANIAWIRVEPV